jgi:hypothetical protein
MILISKELLRIVECGRKFLLAPHDGVDNCQCTTHQSRIALSISRIHFISVKKIVAYSPDGVQELSCRGDWRRLIAKLRLRVVLHIEIFGRPHYERRGNFRITDAFEEIDGQVLSQALAAREGDPAVLSPLKVATLLHGELKSREGGEKPQGLIRWETIEKFGGGEHHTTLGFGVIALHEIELKYIEMRAFSGC